jgi:1,4-dihydroxy-2-naphthoate polyprenyltransferase
MSAMDKARLPMQGLWLSTRGKASAYVRLGKLDIYQIFLPLPLVWSLLPYNVASSLYGIGIVILVLLSVMGVVAAALALDDVTGKRNGVDELAYAGSEKLRGTKMKPLVVGELTESEAMRFAFISAIIGIAMGVMAFIFAKHSSVLLFVIFLLVALNALQYSYGIRTSYLLVGGSEFVVLTSFAGAVIIPYLLITGELTGRVVLEAILMGVWMVQVGVFSNSADAAKDRIVKRRTLAATLAPQANKLFIVGLFFIVWGVTAWGIYTGMLSRWLLVALIPCWILQVTQLIVGVYQNRWLRARWLGFRAYELATLALIVTNVMSWALR